MIIKIYKTVQILFFILLVSACNTTNNLTGNITYGPVQDENFESVFLNSLNDEQQKIIFYSRAIWYPNKNGFKFIPAGKKSRKGVIVYTELGIYFSKWQGRKGYSVEFSSNYEQIELSRLASNELFGRLVIKKDQYNSFEILGVNGAELPNKTETKVAFGIIQQLTQ